MLNGVIDEHRKTYDNLVFIGDFNVGNDENYCDKIFVI